MKRLPEGELAKQAYDQALKYLKIRLHTVGELQEKLKRKNFSGQVVFEVLRRLEELRFLDDTRYAQIYVENLKAYKTFGYYGIKAKLMQRRIPSDIIDETLREFLSVADETAVARRYVLKLKKQERGDYEKMARSLSSKGFRTEVIQQVLREAFSEKR